MSVVQKRVIQFEKLCKSRIRVLVLVTILTAVAIIGFQNFSLTAGNGSLTLSPLGRRNLDVAEVHLSGNSEISAFPSHGVENREVPVAGEGAIDHQDEMNETDEKSDDFDMDGDGDQNSELTIDLGNGMILKKIKDPYWGYVAVEKDSLVDTDGEPGKPLVNNSSLAPVENGTQPIRNCMVETDHAHRRKRRQPPMNISDLNHLLSRNRAFTCSMIPQQPSKTDLQILDAREQILSAPIIERDPELYDRIFRNISMFKRSYELMEKILKVYVYKEGDKPIFHVPELTGIYSSEGWFMKHMEENRQFLINDPRKAHLFYIPLGTRLLEHTLYVPESHSFTPLIEHLKNYIDTIAAKYPFWNRTGGSDHFIVGCHDWATFVTGRAMGTAIRAVCNADVTEDYELGKDVSLTETFVRNRANPLRDVGGKPPKKRSTLAFFAGQMHGYLRPILLQHWENKDPAMKIFGPLPRGTGKKKASYADYMKASKYCLCPRGYEVNSPRVVEAIFYECVPVIISDNFVPPFFEVLNWEAFSVLVMEKDVPRLKEILTSISKRKYQRLYNGVRRVQQHFLWHSQPVKYDLFHMILHNIWFNRVFQLKVR